MSDIKESYLIVEARENSRFVHARVRLCELVHIYYSNVKCFSLFVSKISSDRLCCFKL